MLQHMIPVAPIAASRSLRIERLEYAPEDILPHYLPYGFGASIMNGDYVQAMLIAEKERLLTTAIYNPITCHADSVNAIRSGLEPGEIISVIQSSTLDFSHHRVFGRSMLSPIILRLALQAPPEPADHNGYRWLKRMVTAFDHSRKGVAITCAEELHVQLPIAKSPTDLLLMLLSLYRSLVRHDHVNISSKIFWLAKLIGSACTGSMPSRFDYPTPGFIFSGPPGIGKTHFVCATDYGLIDAEWLAPSHRRDELVYERLTKAGFCLVTDQYTLNFRSTQVLAMLPLDIEPCLRRANIHPTNTVEVDAPPHPKPYRTTLEQYVEGFMDVEAGADAVFIGHNFYECYAKFLHWQARNCTTFPSGSADEDSDE